MDAQAYSLGAARTYTTSSDWPSWERTLTTTLLGLVGETGEAYVAFDNYRGRGFKVADNPLAVQARAELVAELGDVAWYYARLCALLEGPEAFAALHEASSVLICGVTADYWCHGTCARHGTCMYLSPGPTDNPLAWLAPIQDSWKKCFWQGKVQDSAVLAPKLWEKWQPLLVKGYKNLRGLAARASIDMAEVYQANVDKLLARYPDGLPKDALRVHSVPHPFELDIKRGYFPFQIYATCATCGAETCARDFTQDYVSYPMLNSPRTEWVRCKACEAEWRVEVQLEVTLRVVT